MRIDGELKPTNLHFSQISADNMQWCWLRCNVSFKKVELKYVHVCTSVTRIEVAPQYQHDFWIKLPRGTMLRSCSYKESIIPALEYPEHGIMIQWGQWVGSDARHIKEQQECITFQTLHLVQDILYRTGSGYTSNGYIWPFLMYQGRHNRNASQSKHCTAWKSQLHHSGYLDISRNEDGGVWKGMRGDGSKMVWKCGMTKEGVIIRR